MQSVHPIPCSSTHLGLSLPAELQACSHLPRQRGGLYIPSWLSFAPRLALAPSGLWDRSGCLWAMQSPSCTHSISLIHTCPPAPGHAPKDLPPGKHYSTFKTQLRGFPLWGRASCPAMLLGGLQGPLPCSLSCHHTWMCSPQAPVGVPGWCGVQEHWLRLSLWATLKDTASPATQTPLHPSLGLQIFPQASCVHSLSPWEHWLVSRTAWPKVSFLWPLVLPSPPWAVGQEGLGGHCSAILSSAQIPSSLYLATHSTPSQLGPGRGMCGPDS